MIRLGKRTVLIILGCSILAQTANRDYPDWFLDSQNEGYMVGLSERYSKTDISFREAWLDAMSMHHYLKDGIIETNLLKMNNRIADSLGMEWNYQSGEDSYHDDLSLSKISEAKIGNLYLVLFKLSGNRSKGNDRSNEKIRKITATGKFTIKNKRVYEAWINAEIKALTELSKIRESKVRSITKRQYDTKGEKIGKRRFEKLIELKSRSPIYNSRIERRWVRRGVANVLISGYVPVQD